MIQLLIFYALLMQITIKYTNVQKIITPGNAKKGC